jgi:hypothetical protein
LYKRQTYYLLISFSSKVAKIDVKQETPVDHGEITCFSIYGGPEADFGGGKSCIWVDVLDGGGKEILEKFANFFSDPSIMKVSFSFFFYPFYIINPKNVLSLTSKYSTSCAVILWFLVYE